MTTHNHAAFALSNDPDQIGPVHFKALVALIHARTGIAIKPAKKTMLEGRLRRASRAAGLASMGDYCDHVLGEGATDDEIQDLINAVTTNKTDFFREPGHFDYMVNTILPTYAADGLRQINCWSAACSTGAEPYTIAMLLEDFIRANRGVDYRILATDIDTEILSGAVKGIYERDLVAPVPAELRRRYVLQARNPERNPVRIAPELRRKVAFGQLNLIAEHYPVSEKMHLIFCRNVLIYFDKPTQEKVVARLCDQLVPGGFLFLGHSESITGFRNNLEQVSGTIFRRAA